MKTDICRRLRVLGILQEYMTFVPNRKKNFSNLFQKIDFVVLIYVKYLPLIMILLKIHTYLYFLVLYLPQIKELLFFSHCTIN